jgi:transposase
VPHKPGRKPRTGVEAQKQVRAWFVQQPDLTLSEVQQKLRNEASVSLSAPQVGHLLRKMGLRLKKSRSTPAGVIPKPIANSAKSLLPVLGRSHRNT